MAVCIVFDVETLIYPILLTAVVSFLSPPGLFVLHISGRLPVQCHAALHGYLTIVMKYSIIYVVKVFLVDI